LYLHQCHACVSCPSFITLARLSLTLPTAPTPSWNNPNLLRLADKIKSHLVFAHVRAASLEAPISEANCHPWSFGNFMWMHNGFISGFPLIKRRLQQSLPDELFHMITGSTDSEHAFALFLSLLPRPFDQAYTMDMLADNMRKTILAINKWSAEAGVTEASLMNFALTDGRNVVVCRYNNVKPSEAASLFYSSGTKFEWYEPGRYRMVNEDRRENTVIIASEPLTYERADWLLVPENSIITITPKSNVLIYPIHELLADAGLAHK